MDSTPFLLNCPSELRQVHDGAWFLLVAHHVGNENMDPAFHRAVKVDDIEDRRSNFEGMRGLRPMPKSINVENLEFDFKGKCLTKNTPLTYSLHVIGDWNFDAIPGYLQDIIRKEAGESAEATLGHETSLVINGRRCIKVLASVTCSNQRIAAVLTSTDHPADRNKNDVTLVLVNNRLTTEFEMPSEVFEAFVRTSYASLGLDKVPPVKKAKKTKKSK